MPVQKQVNPLAKKLGAKIADAHKMHKDKPVDTGMKRLPPNIRNGVAKLNKMEIGEYKADAKGGLAKQPFFRAAAVILAPLEQDGVKVEGESTSQMIPLCDTPDRKKAPTFQDHWDEYINIFKIFNVDMPPDLLPNESREAASERIWQYFQVAAAELVKQKPTFNFSTREWTPPPMAGKQSTPMLFEEWHGVCDAPSMNGSAVHDNTAPPDVSDQTAVVAAPTQQLPPADVTLPTDNPQATTDVADGEVLDALTAMADSENPPTSEEVKQAILQLQEMGKAAGFDDKEMSEAPDWATLASMIAAAGQQPEPDAAPTPPPAPVKGVHVSYKIKGAVVECEVTKVDEKTRTVQLKNLTTKLVVLDGKKLANVSWDALEK